MPTFKLYKEGRPVKTLEGANEDKLKKLLDGATKEDIYLDDLEAFELAVADTLKGKPLVIDFTASWCPPCKRIGPIFEGLISKYPELVMKKVDVDENE